MDRSTRKRAHVLNERARAADHDGRWDDAEALYREAIDLDPVWAIPWYNLGLVYKRQRRWDESLVCNRQAVRLDERDQAANWNLGIAATAVGEWRIARDAWQRVGLRFPDDSEGFVDLRLGAVPVRVNPQTAPEVVWCRRLDPARARILNVPLPQSERRYGDLVLHDGAPVGERVVDGMAVPMFEEIALLQPSSYATFTVTVAAPAAEAMAQLTTLLASHEAVAEDWSQSVSTLCTTCSDDAEAVAAGHARVVTRGDAQPRLQGERAAGSAAVRGFGIAATDGDRVRAALAEWRVIGPDRTVGVLERVL
jgi:tetratricopeptide (TPR) repeat protein